MLISFSIAIIFYLLVFKLWYPMPYREMLQVNSIFMLVLMIDVICGPLLTFFLMNPKKSRKEIILDLGIIGLIQASALIYGVHTVWVARPAVLAFENDRLIIISANEFDHAELINAPKEFRKIPLIGVLKVATRKPKDNAEFFKSIDQSLAGLSPAMRPSWWEPMDSQRELIKLRAKPLKLLMENKPEQVHLLRMGANDRILDVENLTYLPLTSSLTKDWIALINSSQEIVGYGPIDGF